MSKYFRKKNRKKGIPTKLMLNLVIVFQKKVHTRVFFVIQCRVVSMNFRSLYLWFHSTYQWVFRQFLFSISSAYKIIAMYFHLHCMANSYILYDVTEFTWFITLFSASVLDLCKYTVSLKIWGGTPRGK